MHDVPIRVPVDIPIDVPIAVREHKRLPGSDGPAASGQTPRPSRPRRLSARDHSIIRSVQLFSQVSSSQLLRLYFRDHNPDHRQRRCNKALERLVELDKLGRIERAIGGFHGGSTGYIYIPVSGTARTPDPHTLDITELYVRLEERRRAGRIAGLAFIPEPYSHEQIGDVVLKPDGLVDVTTASGKRFMWYLEIDRGTQWSTRLGQKMRPYVTAYRFGPVEQAFPRVLFIVPDELRARLVKDVARRQQEPALFTVCTFDEATDLLTA